MEFTMKLQSKPFEDFKSGKKVREYRLNDEKRKNIRVGDIIKFKKLPDLEEEFIVDVLEVEHFTSWEECYEKYFDIDFKDRYKDIDEILEDTYNNYYSKEESLECGIVVFTVKKHRIAHLNATACYLKVDDKVLMIKFNKKWGLVYAPPGGKFESGETPLECIKREFKEETGLDLLDIKLQGISYWKDSAEGMIFIYTASDYKGELKESDEGKLEWIDIKDLDSLNQFDQNKKFVSYLFKEEIFEGKFLLDNDCKVIEYEINIC